MSPPFSLLSVIRRAFDAATNTYIPSEQVLQGNICEAQLLVPAASRTASWNTEPQDNFAQRGIIATVNITSAGTGSITVTLERWDPAAGWTTILASATLSSDGVTTLTVYPGFSPSANSVASAVLPRKWRVKVTHNNSNAITYSVGISTLN